MKAKYIDMFKSLLEIVFPSNIYCIACGNIIDKTRPYSLCDDCLENFNWIGEKTCRKCGKILEREYGGEYCFQCLENDYSFERAFACVQYGAFEKSPILQLKYNEKTYIAEKIGEMMYDRISLENLETDIIVPVPMHKKKEQVRGYNQVKLMAKVLARKMNIVYNDKVLIRAKATPPMSKRSREERKTNVWEAFKVMEQEKNVIKGKNILLIDDIFTTGSTADSCSKKLVDGGAKSVNVLVYAIGANARYQEDGMFS